jgi:hypothetical protein
MKSEFPTDRDGREIYVGDVVYAVHKGAVTRATVLSWKLMDSLTTGRFFFRLNLLVEWSGRRFTVSCSRRTIKEL